jgi:hypothetical protein
MLLSSGNLMRIAQPLLKLPIRFDAQALASEVEALGESAWLAHPQQFDGNDGIPLVSPGGKLVNSAVGPMGPTQHLLASPAIRRVMGALESCWGRSRLMGLSPGSQVPQHVDVHYYWRTHLRIHIPVITNPGVRFHAGGHEYHLQAGECWILDSFHSHRVENLGQDKRVHLVLDTVGSKRLFELIGRAQDGASPLDFVADGASPDLQFEQFNFPTIMSPWEIQAHIEYARSWLPPKDRAHPAFEVLDRFVMSWSGAWAEHGDRSEAIPIYRALVDEARQASRAAGAAEVFLTNGIALQFAVGGFVFAAAIAADRERNYGLPSSSARSPAHYSAAG